MVTKPRGPAIVVILLLAAAAEAGDDFAALKADYDRTFTPLPVRELFRDLDEELRLSRRAPYTDAARAEIEAARTKHRLRRAQVLDARREREAVLDRLGGFGGPFAAQALMDAYGFLLTEVGRARENLGRHLAAARTDINPGVDPGGVYWERWLRDSELPAARAVLAEEERLRDLALALCAKLRTPEIVAWILHLTERHDDPAVREQAAASLAKDARPEDAAALGALLTRSREPWMRTMILSAFRAGKTPGVDPFVLGALTDPAWSVRSAAVDVSRSLGLRGPAAVDALVAGLAAETGRLRTECRDALAEATGESFGLAAEEWRLWWSARREGFVPPAAPAVVPPLPDDLPRLCGVPTASRRIAFALSRGKAMAEPVKRRATGNDGKPSPAPAVDQGYRVAVWELGEALATLPEDAEFTVLVFGEEVSLWSPKLRRATKEARQGAMAFAARFAPGGTATLAPALEQILRLGLPPGARDLALSGDGAVDTVYVVGGGAVDLDWLRRTARYRRVVIHDIGLVRRQSDLAATTGGATGSLSAP